jgi:ketosteroid isomerase-like protein
MSSANLDLVRSIYAAWERGDFSSTDWAHPEIEIVVADGPDAGRSTGVAATAERWRDFLSAWHEFRFQADEYRELDDERVLVLYHRSGRGKQSGLELEEIRGEGAHLLHLHDGKVTRHVSSGTATARLPTSASRRRVARRDVVGEPRTRPLDLRSL